jgi:histidinol-phosphate/aromatic aminotransferase/cobyric acid decarboxylase-like protein
VIEQRRRLLNSLCALGLDVVDSQANFAWFRAPDIMGADLAARLEQSRVKVAPGGPLGDERYVRAAIRDDHSVDRLLAALRDAVSSPAEAPATAARDVA